MFGFKKCCVRGMLYIDKGFEMKRIDTKGKKHTDCFCHNHAPDFGCHFVLGYFDQFTKNELICFTTLDRYNSDSKEY